jgi:serine/threonine-protein kinase
VDLEGKMLGNRYELIEKIGGGGMAVVYKAKCHLLKRYVAVKILRDEFTTDSEFLNRFKVESQAAASLSHPNIVSIYDEGNEDGIYYIVMEYVKGQTLKEYILRQGVIDPAIAASIAAQICSAIEHAHKNNIVHRDIKPHNIILTHELIAKVTDFGIAKAASSSTLTMTGNAIGSVHYFSPEQARGGYIDEKSDIYSLGIVLYEMLIGRVPFDGESPVTVALKHIDEPIIPPIQISSSIPKSLSDIVLKAVEKNQADRYKSAKEMLEDLQKAQKDPTLDFVTFNHSNSEEQTTQRVPVVIQPSRVREGAKNISPAANKKEKVRGDENTDRKKSDRATIIAAFTTAFIIILLISGFVGFYITSKFFNKSAEIKAPNLVGTLVDDAKDALLKNGITLTIKESRYDEKAPKDTIMSQTPDASMAVKSPGEIQVVVSLGQEQVSVPDLSAMDYKSAQFELEKGSLVFKPIYEYSAEIPQNNVIRQNPEKSTQVAKNSAVEVYISSGIAPDKVKVPSLIGLSLVEAKAALRSNNLLLGEITYSKDKTRSADTVLSQSILAGADAENLAKVDVVLNSDANKASQASKDIFINISGKGEGKDTFNVRVEMESASGTKVVYNNICSKNDNEIKIPVTGSGKVNLKVFIDNKLDSQEIIDLNQEAYQ